MPHLKRPICRRPFRSPSTTIFTMSTIKAFTNGTFQLRVSSKLLNKPLYAPLTPGNRRKPTAPRSKGCWRRASCRNLCCNGPRPGRKSGSCHAVFQNTCARILSRYPISSFSMPFARYWPPPAPVIKWRHDLVVSNTLVWASCQSMR